MSIQTTVTTTTTTLSFTSTTSGPALPQADQRPRYDEGDIGGGKRGNNRNNANALDNLPSWAKALLKGSDSGKAGNLPSAADAAKSIQDFQKKNNIGLLSIEQMKQMADTGYCTMPNGERKQVPPDVQAAAQKMTDNNAELFKKLEAAIRGSHDGLLSAADYDAALKDGSIGKPGTKDLETRTGLDRNAFLKHVMAGIISSNQPTEYNAAKAIHDFQKQNNIGLLGVEQLKQMADTGYCTMPNGEIKQVPPDVQAAAQKMMDNNGELFKKLESAVTGKFDGLLSKEDFQKASGDNKLSQQDSGSGSGTITININSTAAGGANGADASADAIANKLAAYSEAVDEVMKRLLDTLLSGGVPDLDDLTINFDFSSNESESTADTGGVTGAGSAASAAPSSKSDLGALDAMWKFHKEELGGKNLSREQFQQMADSGKLTTESGATMDVPKEVQEAAKRMMADGGKLFDKLEVAHNGKKDGLVSEADYKDAWKATAKDTIKTMGEFQKNEFDGELLTRAQLKEMAEKGTVTKNNGTVLTVPPEVKEAAKNYMDDDAKLFKQVESWQDNKNDDKLSVKDGNKAADKVELD